MTGILHRAAGLNIAAGRPVPGLPASSRTGPPDVQLHLGASPCWSGLAMQPYFAAAHLNHDGDPIVVVRQRSCGFHFHYEDGTDVWIDRGAAHVWCTWARESSFEDAATYLTGPILGFVLRLRGALALHASAVCVGGGALILAGAPGAGKSTAAAALGVRGFPVITDDVVHVRAAESTWMAEPFGGRLRLWQAGATLALGPAADLPRLTPTWDKRGLEMGTRGVASATGPVPVSSVVFLAAREPSLPAPRLYPMSPAEALVHCAAHGSATQLLDAAARAREFRALDRFVRTVPCARAVSTDSAGRFGEFVDVLARWGLQQSAR